MHTEYMLRCVQLASLGRGYTGINPMVGATLVRDGKIIAEAYHEEFGSPHAEANLIKNLDQKITQEDRLYINLEPCCHAKKKTPPCAQAIIDAGIKHVVIGMLDPNPEVHGKGVLMLRDHGIEVTSPVMRAQCEWFNRGFLSLMTKGRPWVTLKRAISLSPMGGREQWRIAHPDGSKMKITSEEQDIWSHRNLRATHDAILVGVGTIISDDPLLTVRYVSQEMNIQNTKYNIQGTETCGSHLIRIILDPALRIPLEARVVNGELAKGTVIITGANVKGGDVTALRLLQDRCVRILSVPLDASGEFVWPEFWKALTTPNGDFHGISSILVEGGAKTWEAFQRAGTVDMQVTLVGAQHYI